MEAFDAAPETFGEKTPSTLTMSAAAVDVVNRGRRCEWFERFQPGLSFEGHLERQRVRGDRIWTAVITLTAATIGGLIAAVPLLIAR